MKIGDPVEIIPYNACLQPQPNTGFKSYYQYGRVTQIDGSCIMVKPKWQRWEAECYREELRLMSEWEYKIVRNYRK